MSNQIVISSGAKVRSLEGVLTGTAGIVNSVPLGGANGVATLDALGKVPLSQLPASVVTYLGTWNAATNTPTLTNGVGDVGDLYICNVAGTVNFGAGPITFAVGDWVIYSGTEWQKSSGASGTVTSVALTESGDALTITGSPITTSGTINIGFAGTNLQYINGEGNLTTFPSLTGYVPYTGATQNVNLGEYGLSGGFIGFDTTPTSTPTTQGTLSWNADKESLDLIMNGVTGSLMQDSFYNVKNQTGATIPKGKVVKAVGTVGASGRILIDYFLADGSVDSKYCIGVTAENIADGDDGKVLAFGALRQIDTSAFANGTVLYASPTVDGGFTSTEPSNPNNIVTVAIVVYSNSTNGEIFVRPTFVPSEADLINSLGYTPANDALVVHLAGTETITGAKTFSGGASFTLAGGVVGFSGGIAVDKGNAITKGSTPASFSPASTTLYSALGDNNLVLRDSTNTSILQFQAASSYTYTFPSINGTVTLLEGTQTFTGSKTFGGAVSFNFAGSSPIVNYGLALVKGNTPPVTSGAWSNIYASSGNNNLTIADTNNTSVLQFQGSGTLTYSYPSTSGTLALISSATTQTFLNNNIFSGSVQFNTNVSNEDGLKIKLGSAANLTAGYLTMSAYGETSPLPDRTILRIGTSATQLTLFKLQNTGSYTYDFPATNGTIALTSDLSSYVTLSTTQTISGQKTFSGGVLIDTGSILIKNGINATTAGYTGFGVSTSGTTDSFRLYFGSGQNSGFNFTNTGTYTYTLPASNGTIVLGSGTTNYLPKFTGASTLGNSLIYDDGTGIGIGTTTINGKLNVSNGNAHLNNYFTTGTSAGWDVKTYFTGGGSGSEVSLYLGYSGATTDTYITRSSNGRLEFGTSSTARMTILTGGNVGIGTSDIVSTNLTGALTIRKSYNGDTPNGATTQAYYANQSALYLFGRNSGLTIISNNTEEGSIIFGNNSTNAYASIKTGSGSSATGGDMYFQVGSNTERMRITSGGFTKISNNGSYFNVNDTVHEMNNSATTSWTTVFRNTSADPYGLRILYSGASPNGGSNYFIYAQDNTTARFTVSSNGSASSSDERLKKNIETTRDGYLEDLCKLRVVKYNWFNSEDTDDKLLGLIAQEVEAVFPKLIKEEISTDETTTYKMIKDSVLPYMILKALQEANAKIDELSAKVSALENKS